jgi:hypothetical protein
VGFVLSTGPSSTRGTNAVVSVDPEEPPQAQAVDANPTTATMRTSRPDIMGKLYPWHASANRS